MFSCFSCCCIRFCLCWRWSWTLVILILVLVFFVHSIATTCANNIIHTIIFSPTLVHISLSFLCLFHCRLLHSPPHFHCRGFHCISHCLLISTFSFVLSLRCQLDHHFHAFLFLLFLFAFHCFFIANFFSSSFLFVLRIIMLKQNTQQIKNFVICWKICRCFPICCIFTT